MFITSQVVDPVSGEPVSAAGDTVTVPLGLGIGLEAAYLLDETSGTTATDSSGNGNDGAYDRDASNTHETVSGLGSISDAQAFNGTSDEIVGPALGLADADQTISAWVKTTTTTGGYVVSSRNGTVGGLSLLIHTDGTVKGFRGVVALTGSVAAVNDGEWHHVALRYRQTAGECDYFIDGVYDSTQTVGDAWDATVVTTIGNRTAGTISATYYDGSLSRVHIYSRALPSYEIAQLYAEGPSQQLDVARVGHFKLEEASGLVCRNQVRTQLFSFADFGDLGSTDAYGDIPSGGWIRYTSGLEGDETVACNCSADDGTYTVEIIDAGAGVTSELIGVSIDAGIVAGVNYVVKVRARILSAAATAALYINVGGSAARLLANSVSAEFVDYSVLITAAGASGRVFLFLSATDAAAVEIDSIEVTEENAGTPSEDMSGLTSPGVSGRGVLMDGTQHILAPYAAGFGSYPFSMGCAFKRDNTADARAIISIADPDAGNIYWQVQLNVAHFLYVIRRNTTGVVTATGVPVDEDWHTLLAVFEDDTSAKVYLDGVLVFDDSALASVPVTAAANGMMIGDFRTIDATTHFIGSLDEASFWTRALSAAEAAEWHQFTIFPLAARHSAEPLGLETSLSL